MTTDLQSTKGIENILVDLKSLTGNPYESGCLFSFVGGVGHVFCGGTFWQDNSLTISFKCIFNFAEEP